MMDRVIQVSFRPAPHAPARSLLATLEIMLGVTAAHSWAGGALPSVPWLVGLAALVFGAGLLLMRGAARLGSLVLGVGVAQFVLHATLSLMSPATGHVHTDTSLLASLHLSWPMLAAHAASALLTALVWRLRQRAVEAVLHAVRLRPLAPTRRVLTPECADPALVHTSTQPWLSSAPRRGPPLLLVSA